MKRTISLKEIHKSERGASMLEYALLAALLSVVVIAGAASVGQQANTTFNTVATKMGDANYPKGNNNIP